MSNRFLNAEESLDEVYGTSAGGWIGMWLLSGHAQTGLNSDWWHRSLLRLVSNPGRTLLGRPIIDTEQAVRISQKLVPGAFEALLGNPITFHPLATAVDSGESTDLYRYIRDGHTLRKALRATAAMPVLTGPPIELGGYKWLDGGIAEDVPYTTPGRQGMTHLLVSRSRSADQPIPPASQLEDYMVRRYLDRNAPAVRPAWTHRHKRRIEQESALEEGARRNENGCLLQLRPPPGSPGLSLMQRDFQQLRKAIAVGRSTARAILTPAAATVNDASLA